MDGKDVKSPGSFDNVAPDASRIVTPQLAKPKVDLALKVTGDALVQRTDFIANTPVPMYGRVFDKNSAAFETVPFVDQKKIVATTTNVIYLFLIE